MEEEKVLWIELPEGAKYHRIKVAKGSRIGIVYTEECENKKEDAKVAVAKAILRLIPKPEPLIWGNEVYHKNNGTEYWYCKIKDDRDEFMHLYFGDLTTRNVLYYANGRKRKFVTDEQIKFKENFLKAVRNKPKEGFGWIPVSGLSIDTNESIQRISGENVLKYFRSYDWEKIFKDDFPKNEKQEKIETIYFLLLLRWLKDGLVTLEQLASY